MRRELGAMTRARDEARATGDEARAALRRKLGVAEAEAESSIATISALRGEASENEAALAQLRRELVDSKRARDEGEAALSAARADAAC